MPTCPNVPWDVCSKAVIRGMKLKWLSRAFKNEKVSSTEFGTTILDSIRGILQPLCLTLLTFEKCLIAEEGPEITNDCHLQARRAEDFGQFAIDIVIGFLEFMQQWTK